MQMWWQELEQLFWSMHGRLHAWEMEEQKEKNPGFR